MVKVTPRLFYSPGKTRYPLYRRLGGSQGRSGRMRKISPPPPTGIRSPDRPARSNSLYRLRYSGPPGILLRPGISSNCPTYPLPAPNHPDLSTTAMQLPMLDVSMHAYSKLYPFWATCFRADHEYLSKSQYKNTASSADNARRGLGN